MNVLYNKEEIATEASFIEDNVVEELTQCKHKRCIVYDIKHFIFSTPRLARMRFDS